MYRWKLTERDGTVQSADVYQPTLICAMFEGIRAYRQTRQLPTEGVWPMPLDIRMDMDKVDTTLPGCMPLMERIFLEALLSVLRWLASPACAGCTAGALPCPNCGMSMNDVIAEHLQPAVEHLNHDRATGMYQKIVETLMLPDVYTQNTEERIRNVMAGTSGIQIVDFLNSMSCRPPGVFYEWVRKVLAAELPPVVMPWLPPPMPQMLLDLGL